MIDRRAACLIVEREMTRHHGESGKKFRVFDELTIERDWGWVMYYGDSYADVDVKVGGLEPKHAPCLINRISGELLMAGSAWPIEKYIDDYETRLLSS